MAISSTGRVSFGGTSSAWQMHAAWRARRREAAETYLAQASAAGSAFANAWSNQIQGSVELATQAAITRIQAAAKAGAAVNLSA